MEGAAFVVVGGRDRRKGELNQGGRVGVLAHSAGGCVRLNSS